MIMKNLFAVFLLISGLAAAAVEPQVAQEEIVLPTIVIHKPTAMPRGAAIMMAKGSLAKKEIVVGQASEPEPARENPLQVRCCAETE
jgi:hypothetical protein